MRKDHRNNRGIRMICVETYDLGKIQQVAVFRKLSALRQWMLVVLHKPCWIDFGDRIIFNDKDHIYSDRGPHLQFRLHTDDIPEEVFAKFIAEVPCDPDSDTTAYLY